MRNCFVVRSKLGEKTERLFGDVKIFGGGTMAERMQRVKGEVEKLRRHSDEVLMAAVKMANTYRAEGKEKEAAQCDRCAEFIQSLDNPYFMAQISLG